MISWPVVSRRNSTTTTTFVFCPSSFIFSAFQLRGLPHCAKWKKSHVGKCEVAFARYFRFPLYVESCYCYIIWNSVKARERERERESDRERESERAQASTCFQHKRTYAHKRRKLNSKIVILHTQRILRLALPLISCSVTHSFVVINFMWWI